MNRGPGNNVHMRWLFGDFELERLLCAVRVYRRKRDGNLVCTCQWFQRDGVPCRHILQLVHSQHVVCEDLITTWDDFLSYFADCWHVDFCVKQSQAAAVTAVAAAEPAGGGDVRLSQLQNPTASVKKASKVSGRAQGAAAVAAPRRRGVVTASSRRVSKSEAPEAAARAREVGRKVCEGFGAAVEWVATSFRAADGGQPGNPTTPHCRYWSLLPHHTTRHAAISLCTHHIAAVITHCTHHITLLADMVVN